MCTHRVSCSSEANTSPGSRHPGLCVVQFSNSDLSCVCITLWAQVRNLNSLSLPGAADIDLCPPKLQQEIDELNTLVYEQVDSGFEASAFPSMQCSQAPHGMTLQHTPWPTAHSYDAASFDLYPEMAGNALIGGADQQWGLQKRIQHNTGGV